MLTFALYFPASLAILFQDSISLEFSDQGRKLLGGFAVAVVAVLAFTVIKFRRRDKNPPKPLHFMSLPRRKRYFESRN